MKTFFSLFSTLSLGFALFTLPSARPISMHSPATFGRDEHIVILVTGDALQSKPFGFSGSGSLYRASGTSTAGRLTFTLVQGAQNISLERRSGVDMTNRNNYGTNAYIPPGIYFLHYHRFDSSSHQARHRLGLSDRKCGESITFQIGNQSVNRSELQFHVAFNDLEDFHPTVSKGCITLTTQNFFTLFPDNFFADDSPLPSCATHQPLSSYNGQGNILVFVTDVTNTDIQNNQIQIFQGILSGNANNGLRPADFAGGTPAAGLVSARTRWRIGAP